jgi:hypothetical protein
MAPETLEVPIAVTLPGGEPVGGYERDRPPATMKMTVPQYFRGVPRHLRDASRYAVQRVVHLGWFEAPATPEMLRVSHFKPLVAPPKRRTRTT